MEQSIMTKPTIVIYCAPNVTESMFSNFLFGIEEEGLPWHIESRSDQSELFLADLASQDSALSVGVGITPKSIALTYKNLPPNLFVYRLQDYKDTQGAQRVLGINAARLAKGNPFKTHTRLEVSF